jgi:hypothetical protein
MAIGCSFIRAMDAYLLMTISSYFIGGYWTILLMAIGGYYIGGYSIDGYKWIVY